jgi:hypothetical protein
MKSLCNMTLTLFIEGILNVSTMKTCQMFKMHVFSDLNNTQRVHASKHHMIPQICPSFISMYYINIIY